MGNNVEARLAACAAALILSGCAAGPSPRPVLGGEFVLRAAKLGEDARASLRFPLSAYYACEALKAGSGMGPPPAPCAKPDALLPFEHEYSPTCRSLYYQALMIRDAASPGKAARERAVGWCAELSRLREAGRKDADDPAEAARFCRGLLERYAAGDPGGVCDYMRAEDGEYGAETRTGEDIGRDACVSDNVFLIGEPDKCEEIDDRAAREHCRAKAGLVLGARTGERGAAAGTMYGPALDRRADCGAAGRALDAELKRFEELAPRAGGYAGPRELVSDFARATAGLEPGELEVLNIRLSNYFACEALREGSEEECDAIDPLTADAGNPTDMGGSHCREEYHLGRIIQEAYAGRSGVCVSRELAEGESPDEVEEYCEDLRQAILGGNPEEVCGVVHAEEGAHGGRSGLDDADKDRCLDHFRGVSGDASDCEDIRGLHREHCLAQAALASALRSGRRGDAKGGFLEPLVNPSAGCAAPAAAAMSEYARLRGAAAEAADRILESYPEAVARVSSRETVDQLFAEYLACRALEADSTEPCARLDRHRAGGGDPADIGASHCVEEFHQGRMIRDAWTGGGTGSCVLAEAAEGSAPGEARRFCEGLLEGYKSGDPDAVCRFLSEDGSEPGGGAGAARCRPHHLGLAGDAALCGELEGLHREHCESQAALVRAFRDGDARLAGATMYAPLTDPPGDCAGAARRALKEYALMSEPSPAPDPAPAGYADAEALISDYPKAMAQLKSTVTVTRFIIDYLTCEAFRAGSNAGCLRVDRYLPRAEDDPYLCRTLFTEGYMLRELASGAGTVSACVEDDRVWGEYIEPGSDGRDSEAFCRASIPYLSSGDLDGYCDFVGKDEARVAREEGRPSEFDRAKCLIDYAYITGDPEKCSLYGGDALKREYCMDKGRLVRASRLREPRHVRGTYFEPLMHENGSCSGLADRVLREYDIMRKVR